MGIGFSACVIRGNHVHVLRHYLSVLTVACLVTFTGAEASASLAAPKIVEGGLDLRDRDFSPGRIELSGEWQVAWREFVEPTSFFSEAARQNVSIPDDWGVASRRGRPFNKVGHATYGLKVLLPDTHPELAIDLGSMYYASKIYVDGRLVHQRGVPAATAAEEEVVAWSRVGIVNIPASQEGSHDLELVVQLSNHIHANGGFRAAMIMGEANYIIRGDTIDIVARLMLIGASLLLALYHLVLFFNRKEEWAFLSFSIFVLGIAVHGVCNLALMSLVFPAANATLMLHIEYLSLIVSSLFGVMFVWHVYPEVRWRPAWLTFLGYNIGGAALILLTPTLVFTGFLPVIKFGILTGLALAITSLVVAVYRRFEGARLFLVSVFITAAGSCYGMLMHSLEAIRQTELSICACRP